MKRVILGAAAGGGLGLALVGRTWLRAPALDGFVGTSTLPLASSLPNLAWLLLAVAAFGAVGAWLGRMGKESLATPFLPGWLAGAIFLPGVYATVPFLATFGGRFLDLVLVVAGLLALHRLVASRPPSFRTMSPNGIFVAAFLLYLGVGLFVSHRVGLSGDEPHYLLVTESLLRDLDLAVQNNYANEDFRRFYPGPIGAHLAEGTPYSVHGVGLSILLLPGFALGGLVGVVVTEALVAALLLRAVYGMALDVTGRYAAALFAAAAFGLTAPALFLGVAAYPELPAAWIATSATRRLLDPSPPTTIGASTWMLALGTLPFFHVKFAPLLGLLVVAFFLRFWRSRGAARGIAVGAVSSVAALALFSFLTVGSFDPTASYGRQRIFLERIPVGLAGLFFDQEFGVLLNAPVYLLGLAGLASLYRRSRIAAVVSCLALLCVALPGAAHPLWSGGTSPPGRFLFPALPLLAVAAAALFDRERKEGVGPWAMPLLGTSLALSLGMLLLPGGPFHLNAKDGTGRIWEVLSQTFGLVDYLPSLVRADPRSLVVASVLAAFVVAAIAAQVRRWRRRLPPLVLLLLVALALQDWTGVLRSRVLETSWVLNVMEGLSENTGERFVLLPSRDTLSAREVALRFPLALDTFEEDGDPAHWWSRSYPVPAGRYELSGVGASRAAFCNGESCFQTGRLELTTRVALAALRVRARRLSGEPTLRLVEPEPPAVVALRTLGIEGGLRLHGLDDEAYLDPSGFWVRGGALASFAIEAHDASVKSVVLQIANGGAPNVVRVEWARTREKLALAAWEQKRLAMELDGSITFVRVESEGSFRPSDLDPASRDRRELGVLVR